MTFDIAFTNSSTNIFDFNQTSFQHFKVNCMPKNLQYDYCLLIKTPRNMKPIDLIIHEFNLKIFHFVKDFSCDSNA